MAEPLIIAIPRKLGKEETLGRVKPAPGKASENFPVLKVEEEVWSGDRLILWAGARQVAAGNAQVAEDYKLPIVDELGVPMSQTEPSPCSRCSPKDTNAARPSSPIGGLLAFAISILRRGPRSVWPRPA